MDASSSTAAPSWHWVTIARGEPDMFGRPALALGDRCACCNIETKQTVTAGRAPQVYVPCCEACRRHLAVTRHSVPRAAVLCAVCVSLAGISRWFFVVAAISLWIALTTVGAPLVFAREGHWPGLRVRVADETVLIGTTNARFAETVRALNVQS